MPTGPFEIFIPLITARYPQEAPKLRFWRDSEILILGANSSYSTTWNPPQGREYYVFGLTFGRLRDWDTGDVLISDDIGVWHRHDPQMVWHLDLAVESLYEFSYPHYLEVERGTPIDLYFYNNTGLTIIWDYSIWIFESKVEDSEDIRKYVKGYFNLFRALGEVRVGEIVDFIRALPRVAPPPPPIKKVR